MSPCAVLVNRVGDKFLARARFAFDQSRRISGRDRANQVQYLYEGTACSDDVLEAIVHTFGLDRLTASASDIREQRRRGGFGCRACRHVRLICCPLGETSLDVTLICRKNYIFRSHCCSFHYLAFSFVPGGGRAISRIPSGRMGQCWLAA